MPLCLDFESGPLTFSSRWSNPFHESFLHSSQKRSWWVSCFRGFSKLKNITFCLSKTLKSNFILALKCKCNQVLQIAESVWGLSYFSSFLEFPDNMKNYLLMLQGSCEEKLSQAKNTRSSIDIKLSGEPSAKFDQVRTKTWVLLYDWGREINCQPKLFYRLSMKKNVRSIEFRPWRWSSGESLDISLDSERE